MTINIQMEELSAPIPPVTVHHHIQNGVEGYLFRIPGKPLFIPENEADKLARYMLFNKPELIVDSTD